MRKNSPKFEGDRPRKRKGVTDCPVQSDIHPELNLDRDHLQSIE
jgi:hypothetical protein